MYYEDLLAVPYKTNGRELSGMDCYGLVIECCRRVGKDLHDVVYASEKVPYSELTDYVKNLNVVEIDSAKPYCIVQCEYEGMLHLCFVLDKTYCIHATVYGVSVSPVAVMRNKKYFEVIK